MSEKDVCKWLMGSKKEMMVGLGPFYRAIRHSKRKPEKKENVKETQKSSDPVSQLAALANSEPFRRQIMIK